MKKIEKMDKKKLIYKLIYINNLKLPLFKNNKVTHNNKWAAFDLPTDTALAELGELISTCTQLSSPLAVSIDTYRSSPDAALLTTIHFHLNKTTYSSIIINVNV